jgi:cystathionine beta-lyase/cystathionine gamma-synthase
MGAPDPKRGTAAGPSTTAVHAGDVERTAGGPVVNPIHQTSTFFNAPEGGAEVLYTRFGNNPNQVALERRIAALEGAEDAVVTGSGMAAMAMALLGCAEAGTRIASADALYGGTRVLLDRELSRLGIRTDYLDFHAPGWADRLTEGYGVVLVELPTNPLLRVPDLPAIARAARRIGAVVVVDSTFATPINLRPLEHGAHLVVHSATKYLGGHSDVTAGAVVGGGTLLASVRDRTRIFGPSLDPHAAWLVERGIKTLAVRMERHERNGHAVAEWCEAHPAVRQVYYPGLPSHPDHALAGRLLGGYGGMLGVELRGGGEAATRVVRRLRLARVASSLGGVDTLVSEPRHTSHMAMTAQQREQAGIRDGFLRFSLGIEDAEDIIADLRQALDEEPDDGE